MHFPFLSHFNEIYFSFLLGELVTLGDVLQTHLPQLQPASYPVLVHGISPPLQTPITWLAYHCAHPDNFLYIVVIN